MRAVSVLACPHCGAVLEQEPGGVVCAVGHRFDRAKQGHLTLLGPRARLDTGDSTAMVDARTAFLDAGHYRPIADAVANAVDAFAEPGLDPVIVELGAGIGWYLDRLVSDLGRGSGIALDSSKAAARRAARLPGIVSVVADAWSPLPLLDGSIDVVTSIFAPRDGDQVVRVLRPGGVLVVVTPLSDHLLEVRESLAMLTVDEGKADRLQASLPTALVEVGRDELRFQLDLSREDAAALVGMGPAARHLSAAEIAAKAAALAERTAVTAAVTVQTFRRS